MSVIKVVKVVLIGLVAIIAISETYFRVKFYEELKYQCTPLVYQYDSQYGYRFIPDRQGEISRPGIGRKSFRTNHEGYYSPEFTVKKKPGIFRILIVGASFASGVWMDGKENYSVKLQKQFEKNGNKVEIINCSIDGEGRGLDNLRQIQTELLKLNPDLVLCELSFPVSYGHMYREVYKNYVLQFYTDSTKELSKKAIDEIESRKCFKFFYNCSFIVRSYYRDYMNENPSIREARLVRTYRDGASRIDDMDESFFTFRKSIDLLKQTDDSVNAHGGKLVLLSYWKEKNNLQAYLKTQHLTPLYLNCTFDSTQLSLPDGHLNEKGHTQIAKVLFKELIENKFYK